MTKKRMDHLRRLQIGAICDSTCKHCIYGGTAKSTNEGCEPCNANFILKQIGAELNGKEGNLLVKWNVKKEVELVFLYENHTAAKCAEIMGIGEESAKRKLYELRKKGVEIEQIQAHKKIGVTKK